MRLQVSFVVLLLIAATATSVTWREFSAARDGDTGARMIVLALAPVGAAALVLLGRIIVRVQAAGRPGERE